MAQVFSGQAPLNGLSNTLAKGVHRRHKMRTRLVFLSITVLACGIIGLLNAPVAKHRLDAAFLDVTGPFLQLSQSIVDDGRALIRDYTQHQALVSENTQLHQEIHHLRLAHQTMLQKNGQLTLMLTPLRLQQNLLPEPLATLKVTGIIATPQGARLSVEAGKDLGLQTNFYAVSGYGLIGRITAVAQKYAQITPLTDMAIKTPIMLSVTGHRGILVGQGDNRRPKLELIHPPALPSRDIADGDLIVTSGDGGIFAPAIPIGILARCGEAWCARLFSGAHPPHHVMIFPTAQIHSSGDVVADLAS